MSIAAYTSIINAGVAAALEPNIAQLSDFSTAFSAQEIQGKTALEVAVVTAESVLTNPTSYGGGGTTTIVNVPVDVYSVQFGVSEIEYQNGYRLAELVAENAIALAEKLQAVLLASLSGTSTVTGTVDPATFALANLQTGWAAVKGNRKVAVLNQDCFAKLLTNSTQVIDPLAGAPIAGFKRVSAADNWTGAPTKTVGFVADKCGIAIASAVPALPPKVAEQVPSINVNLGNGLTAGLRQYVDVLTRKEMCSLDIAFGAAVVKTAAVKRFVTA